MSKLSRTTALELISNWSTNQVVEILKKNGLEECCQAVLKRQIDGDELLHLTEGKLTLWKSDLSRPQIWTLWNFVEEIRRVPEEYLPPPTNTETEETMSDTASWGSDFEDDDEEEVKQPDGKISDHSANFRNSLLMFEKNGKFIGERKTSIKSTGTPETIYMNCPSDDDETTYMNVDGPPIAAPLRRVSQVRNTLENSLAAKLKEELKRITKNEPTIENKPEVMRKPVVKPSIPTKRPQMTKPQAKQIMKKPLPAPSTCQKNQKIIDRPDDLPRPPLMLRSFDLLANLPIKADESDDEYEPFDEHIIEQNQKKFGSKQSVLGSVESVYKPSSSTTSQEKEEDDSEIYECITETPEDNGYYLQPIPPSTIKTSPPPLPAKPNLPGDTPAPSRPTHNERSPDKKIGNLSHSGSASSVSEMRATRPLPPPPDRANYMDSTWFHNVTREQATALIKDRPHNGYFLLRPSNTNPNHPFVLVVWFNDGVYNVQVRKRSDNRYALGSEKPGEKTFSSIEEIVQFHSREELPLCRGKIQTGSTLLVDTPPK